MGTSYCALFIFRTQDIVPTGTEDTPVVPCCQMGLRWGRDQLKCYFLFYYHLVKYLLLVLKKFSNRGLIAEIRLNTGIRFVANRNMRYRQLLK